MPNDQATISDVIYGNSRWAVQQGAALEWLRELPPNSVDLVVGSPPYVEKNGRYKNTPGPIRRWTCPEWVEYIYQVTLEARRVCKGDVLWVVNGSLKDARYTPAVEGLVWKWYETGHKLERPLIWHKNAPPNRRDWFSNDWEFIVCFPAEGRRRVWNWESIGTAPKYSTGGDFRQRNAKGERTKGGKYPKNPITRPRDVLRVCVGGGLMGHPLASKNEAPFPTSLIEPLVKALSNPNGIVCDPFLGGGSSCQVAVEQGRRFVGCDLRESQVELTRERMKTVRRLFKMGDPCPGGWRRNDVS